MKRSSGNPILILLIELANLQVVNKSKHEINKRISENNYAITAKKVDYGYVTDTNTRYLLKKSSKTS